MDFIFLRGGILNFKTLFDFIWSIDFKDFFSGLGGVVIGGFLTWITTKWLEKEKLKKELQQRTSDELIKLITSCTQSFSKVSSYLFHVEYYFKSYKGCKDLDIKMDNVWEEHTRFWKSSIDDYLNFIYFFDGNKVIMNKFLVFREVIYDELMSLLELNSEFSNLLSKCYHYSLTDTEIEDDISKLFEQTKVLQEKIGELSGYMLDFNNELQNHLYSKLFKYNIPVRKPLDSNVKVISLKSKYNVENKKLVD